MADRHERVDIMNTMSYIKVSIPVASLGMRHDMMMCKGPLLPKEASKHRFGAVQNQLQKTIH